jgi:hypothetical protein
LVQFPGVRTKATAKAYALVEACEGDYLLTQQKVYEPSKFQPIYASFTGITRKLHYAYDVAMASVLWHNTTNHKIAWHECQDSSVVSRLGEFS